MKTPKHVLILGCGRSGTSIFGELFDHLPEYTYYSEPDFAELEEMDFSKPIAIKVPKESLGYKADPGLSFPRAELPRLMPGPRQLFWQVRHPLDTVASLKVGISRNWGHHPRPPDWEEWLSAPLEARCAHHWNHINSVGYDRVADQVIVTRFENMIREPLRFAQNICLDLRVDPDKDMRDMEDWARRVQDTNNTFFVEAQTSRAYSTRDHQVRIGRWRENLPAGEVDLIWPMVEETAAVFGYEK